MDEECFWKHYEHSGTLDFLSFFSYGPALLGCSSFPEYEFDFCFKNFSYVLAEGFSRRIAPPTSKSWFT